MDVIIHFGGGGSLGAFDAGVWAALAPRFRACGARLAAVGGVSIGAVNAALLASRSPGDPGSDRMLDAVWRDELATPSIPFNGALVWWGGRDARSWNGVLTGLLAGNRRLYRAEPAHWNPLQGLARRRHPLMDRRGEWAWLRERIGEVPRAGGGTPVLCVAAVDVLAGTLAHFDNAAAPLGIEAIAASSAIPALFEPVEIDGRPHWDGEMTRDSALPGFVARARPHLRDGVPVLLVAVDHMSRELPRAPESGLEIADRVLELLLVGKTQARPQDLAGVDHVLRIEREPMPHDGVSGQFDYSPERVDELIAQGAAQAEAAWAEAEFPTHRPAVAAAG